MQQDRSRLKLVLYEKPARHKERMVEALIRGANPKSRVAGVYVERDTTVPICGQTNPELQHHVSGTQYAVMMEIPNTKPTNKARARHERQDELLQLTPAHP